MGHLSDEPSHLRGDSRSALLSSAALPGPIEPEAGPLPADDGLGLDDGEDVGPAAPQSVEEDPEEAVAVVQAWTRRGALEDGQLVPQRQIFEH